MEDSNNNIYTDFPALMADSRLLTQYNLNINEELRNKLGIQYNWEYRNYLTNNSNEIIEYNKTEACKELLESYDRKSCIYDNKNHNINDSSDLKNQYIESEKLQSAMTAPEIPQYKKLRLRHKRSN